MTDHRQSQEPAQIDQLVRGIRHKLELLLGPGTVRDCSKHLTTTKVAGEIKSEAQPTEEQTAEVLTELLLSVRQSLGCPGPESELCELKAQHLGRYPAYDAFGDEND